MQIRLVVVHLRSHQIRWSEFCRGSTFTFESIFDQIHLSFTIITGYGVEMHRIGLCCDQRCRKQATAFYTTWFNRKMKW